jgi:hypothetical protein
MRQAGWLACMPTVLLPMNTNAPFAKGAGMAIAALARIARWTKHGAFTSSGNTWHAAKRAFAHLLSNNTLKYDDDGNENIIDDYCALMAATELMGKPPMTRNTEPKPADVPTISGNA